MNGFRRLKAEVGEGDLEGVLREVEGGDGVKSGGVVGVEGLHHRVNQPNVLDAPMAVFVELFEGFGEAVVGRGDLDGDQRGGIGNGLGGLLAGEDANVRDAVAVLRSEGQPEFSYDKNRVALVSEPKRMQRRAWVFACP